MERDSIIFVCFKLGFKQREIVGILQSQFSINVSEHHLRRILCKLNLHRGEHRGNLSFPCKSDGNSLQTHSTVIVHLVYTGADAKQSELK